MKAVAVFPARKERKLIEQEAPRISYPDEVMLCPAIRNSERSKRNFVSILPER